MLYNIFCKTFLMHGMFYRRNGKRRIQPRPKGWKCIDESFQGILIKDVLGSTKKDVLGSIMKNNLLKKAARFYRTVNYCMVRAELYMNEANRK